LSQQAIIIYQILSDFMHRVHSQIPDSPTIGGGFARIIRMPDIDLERKRKSESKNENK